MRADQRGGKIESLVSFFERVFYDPRWYHRVFSLLLFPLSLIYCTVARLQKRLCSLRSFDIPIVSIGNLIVGGSGKTPLLIELASRFEGVAVVLRGYGRESRGVVQVSRQGEILVDVRRSGDEAMLIARSLPRASVYVSEDRGAGIARAIEEGAKVVFLDDGFRHCICKMDILIDLSTPNNFCLPAGPYRLPRRLLKEADLVVREGVDFWRRVSIENPTPKMVLVTAIANPSRLDPYLPPGIKRYHFKDHHSFTKRELEEIWHKEHPTSLLVTSKDLVKLERFGYPLSLLRLQLEIDARVETAVRDYIERGLHAKKATDCPDAP